MEELEKLVSAFGHCIAYTPLSDEVAFPFLRETYVLPLHADTDPFIEAEKVAELFKETSVCILVPGTQFDTHGTRHGRGGGWYDRFLSKVPKEWIRIGVCFERQFSTAPLIRHPWDESMHYVYIQKGKGILYQVH